MADNNDNDKKNSVHVVGAKQPGMVRTSADYARQQEDLRATQTYGESSLNRGSDRQHHTDRPPASTGQELGRSSEERERGQGVQKGTGKPV